MTFYEGKKEMYFHPDGESSVQMVHPVIHLR